MSVDEDYFIPVRGGDTGTKIESLAGGQNTSAIEDVEYIQKKLFAALKIPKAYLGYDEDIGAKATLAQEDIRFSRTITRIQKTVLAELNKLAMIHLYAHGFADEDLLDFELQLSNPSAIAQQQKLELINTKFSIAGSAPEGVVSRSWILKNVMGFTRDEIDEISRQKMAEKIQDLELEAAQAPEADGGDGGGDAGGDDAGGGDDEGGGLFDIDYVSGGLLDGNPITASEMYREADEDSEDEDLDEIDLDGLEDLSIKKSNKSRNVFGGELKKNKTQRQKHHIPDFASMVGVGRNTRTQDSMNRPYDEDFVLGRPFKEAKLSDFLIPEPTEYLSIEKPRMSHDFKATLEKFGSKSGFSRVLNEGESDIDSNFKLDLDDEEE